MYELERFWVLVSLSPLLDLNRFGRVRVAEVVCKEMGLQDVAFRFTGGVDGGRGWRGDVKTMLLSADKLLSLG
jgi:hypothetical protein